VATQRSCLIRQLKNECKAKKVRGRQNARKDNTTNAAITSATFSCARSALSQCKTSIPQLNISLFYVLCCGCFYTHTSHCQMISSANLTNRWIRTTISIWYSPTVSHFYFLSHGCQLRVHPVSYPLKVFKHLHIYLFIVKLGWEILTAGALGGHGQGEEAARLGRCGCCGSALLCIGKNNNNVQTMANKVIMLDLSWFDMLCDGGMVEWWEGEQERMNRQKQLQKWLRNWHGSFKAALSAPNDACRSQWQQ